MLHHLTERLVVRHARGVWRILLRILVRRVGSDLGGDVVDEAAEDAVGVGEVGAELLVEAPEDVRQPIELRLGLVAAAGYSRLGKLRYYLRWILLFPNLMSSVFVISILVFR